MHQDDHAVKQVDEMTDLEVKRIQKQWNPKQYEDWPEPSRSKMMQIAERYYTMTTKDYRQRLRDLFADGQEGP